VRFPRGLITNWARSICGKNDLRRPPRPPRARPTTTTHRNDPRKLPRGLPEAWKPICRNGVAPAAGGPGTERGPFPAKLFKTVMRLRPKLRPHSRVRTWDGKPFYRRWVTRTDAGKNFLRRGAGKLEQEKEITPDDRRINLNSLGMALRRGKNQPKKAARRYLEKRSDLAAGLSRRRLKTTWVSLCP